MNFWLWAATAFLVLIFPAGIGVTYGSPMERLASLQLAGFGIVIVLLLLAQGFGRESFYDLAFAMALLSVVGGFLFAHVHERWL